MEHKKRIPLATPTMSGAEMAFVQEAFDTNWVAPLGKNVDELEQELAAYLGVGHAVALSSGTAAIHLTLKAAEVGSGDVVFCSDLTFAASCNPIKYEYARPIFIDSERDSWNMCPRALEKAFQQYPEAKAVIAVNLYGTPARLDEIAILCAKYGAIMIEDAAESLGSIWKGKQTGSFGKLAVLSFNGNKIITTSGGGMLLCDDETVAGKARFWATQSRDPARHYQHSELGYNYRMSNICAGIGRGQMTVLDERIRQKRTIFTRYQQAFAGNPHIRMNPIPKEAQANCWLSCLILEPGSPVTPLQIIERLEQENIETRPIWKPMSLQPYYADCNVVSLFDKEIVGHDIFARGLCLPSDVKMTENEQMQVCDLILSMV